MKIKKYLIGLTSAALIFVSFASPVLAVVAPKADGSIIYNAYGLQRYARFAVQKGSTCSDKWDLSGNWKFDFVYQASHYVHDATLSQSDGNVTGTGGYPSGGPYTYTWNLTGTVTGNSVNFTVNYVTGTPPGTVMTMTGNINGSGHLVSGHWTDNFGGTRNGTWTSSNGAAVKVTTCNGSGYFNYADDNGGAYKVDVKKVTVKNNTAYFAGPVTGSSPLSWMSNWLYAEAFDSGLPGGAGDQIWGTFYSQADALTHYSWLDNPTDGPFAISLGNILVH